MKNKRQFTNQEVEEIIELYTVERVAIEKIARTFKCANPTIKECLKSNGIPVIKGNLQNIDEKTIDKAVVLLNEGKSLCEIEGILNCNRNTLSKKLRARGCTIVNHQNQVKFDETIFDIIDTEEKAYWLGFIFADGYISSPLTKGKYQGKNLYAFGLTLQLRDINHLIKFNNFTKHNKNNVRTDVKDSIRPHCRWDIKNKHLWESLNRLGCTPRKSLTLKFPDVSIFSDEELIIPFIRGFFDGDGCLSYCKSGYNKKIYPKCGFTGTEDMLKHIEQKLGKIGHYYDCTGFNGENNGITKQLWFGCNDTVEIINTLYKNANIYLDRKYELYNFFKNGSRSLKEFNELLEGKIGELCDENTEVSSEIAKGSETL